MLKPNFVLVIDTTLKPLTPCTPCIARKLLEAGKAPFAFWNSIHPKISELGSWQK